MSDVEHQSLTPVAPPVSPRGTMQHEDKDDTSHGNNPDPIEIPCGKAEPSLQLMGITSPVSTRRAKSPLNRISSAGSARLYGHLNTIRSRSKTEYVQEDIISVHHQRRSSSPLSYKSSNSTTRMKHLPLPHHSHTTVPFPRVGSARGVRSVPVCTDRYLGTDRKSSKSSSSSSLSHYRSKSSEKIKSPRSFNDQVTRFDDERRQLYSTRTLKKITEIYSHRLDDGYFMAGTGLGLGSKYHVDDEELERLREFSRAKLAHQTGSASSQRLRNRERLSSPRHGFFVTQNNAPFDALSGMVISGQQINSTAPSEAGKTVNTRPSSAASERIHGIVGDNAKDKDNKQNAGDNAGDDGKTKVAGDGRSNGDNKEATGDGGSVAIETNHSGNNENQNVGAKTNSDQNNFNGDTGDGINNPNHDGHGDGISNHGDDLNNHGDGTGDGIGSLQLQAHETGHDGETTRIANGVADNGSAVGVDGAVNGAMDGAMGHGRGDADGVHGSQYGKTDVASVDGKDSDGEENDEQGKDSSGDLTDATNEEVLQISLTSGITLISKPSKLRNKEEVFMTNFDSPDISRLRSEMEDIQYVNNLHSNDNDDDAEDDMEKNEDGNNSSNITGVDDVKKYQLNTRDSEISRMEENLKKVKLLEAGISDVGHLTESKEDLKEIQEAEEQASRVASGDYDAGVFAQTKNDEELKDAQEKRAAKQERLRSPYKPSMKEGNVVHAKVKKPYRFQLSDIYKFITPRQKAIFEEKFEQLDTNGNGKVTLKELSMQMKKANAPKPEIKKFMQVFDLNKDKTISKREFVTVAALNDKLTGHVTQSEKEPLRLDLDTLAFNITAYKEMFELTDSNRDGRLNVEEIMLIVALSVGIDIGSDKEVIKHIHKTIDADDDGSIDFIEFLSYIPFFLKLHYQILGRPASIGEIEEARIAVKKAVLKASVK